MDVAYSYKSMRYLSIRSDPLIHLHCMGACSPDSSIRSQILSAYTCASFHLYSPSRSHS